MPKNVILVDEADNAIGVMEKIQAHKEPDPRLHRAFSIFVFNSEGKMLLQQRALSKYHFGGLWSNTCCSHPIPGSDINKDVHSRLQEEMGFDCELDELFTFTYKAPFNNGLTEWEMDHVFKGTYEGTIKPNQEEVEDYKWVTVEELLKDIKEHSEKYTPWFKIALDRVLERLL
jgi:isopentenyl-diphosphate delta-isomerase